MKTISIAIYLLLISILNLKCQSKCITIKYVGEIDVPIYDLIICQSLENNFKKDTSKIQIDIDSISYKNIEDYIMASKLLEKSKCNSFANFGSYLIKVESEVTIICFILDSPKKSEKFFWGLIKSMKNLNSYLDYELKYRLKRTIGYVKYEKKYDDKD